MSLVFFWEKGFRGIFMIISPRIHVCFTGRGQSVLQSDEDKNEMTEQTKEQIDRVSQVACPTLGVFALLGLVAAGITLSVMSVVGVILIYEPTFFGMTFSAGVVASCIGLVFLAHRLFEMKQAK